MSIAAWAQTTSLQGRVTDPTGALVPDASIVLNGPAGFSRTTKSAGDGTYSFPAVPRGTYTIRCTAPGLTLQQAAKVTVAGVRQVVNLQLSLAGEKQEVTVADNGKPQVSTEAGANASAVILKGTDLDALSDNPDDLLVDLQALAGPAAGPNGGSIFIDGFSGGELPAKNSIREIRINQNPFSPEYDKLGLARIEIFTKPGTEKWHADLGYNFATDKWNSRNPYAEQKAPFHLHEFREALSGPINKRASFTLNATREWVDNGNVVNGVTLDPQTLQPVTFTGTPVSELRRTLITPRVDYQLSTNHTLSMRYSYSRDIVRDAGTGSLNLVSRGYHNDALSHTFQLTETAILNNSAINETRFQYYRPSTVAQANSPGYAIQVLGAFNAGGNPLGRTTNLQNGFELQNNTSIFRGRHAWRFGVRLRGVWEDSMSPQNFAGTFTFSGGLAPQLDANNTLLPNAPLLNISSIESYRRTVVLQRLGLPAAQIRQLGGGASQFSINAGNPAIAGNQTDIGIFAGDDFRARQNLTISFGLRYETQSNIHDWSDFAPRIGVAWAPGKVSGKSRPKSVIRAGFGMFYDRFALGNTLAAQRYNGTVQQQYVIANPDFFPSIPSISSLGFAPPNTIEQVSGNLRAPYLMQTAVGFERQLPYSTTVAITYASTHGLHMLRSRDINAPLIGTALYPFGRPGLVALMESSGLYNQNQIIFNVNSRVNSRISLTGSYAYGRAMSNTDGVGTFPANPYNFEGEYGPAATDMHHRFSSGGTINAKWGLRFNPLLSANTGPPFDITAGRDLYGNTLFNGRPALATDPNKPGVVNTAYGLLDPNPSPIQQVLSRNFGRGPGQIMVNLRVGRTFVFGGSREGGAVISSGGAPASAASNASRGTADGPFSMGGGPSGPSRTGRRYSLTISMQVRNLTNHNNPGPIIGNVTSPLFGMANQPAGSGNAIFAENANNRRLELQTRFTF